MPQDTTTTTVKLGDTDSVNSGSVVGLPVDSKSNSSDEEDSADELTKAGDALCQSLLQQQQQQQQQMNKLSSDHQDDDRPHLTQVETRSTPSPSPPSEPNSTNKSLEERVQELETKLATLSRILQQQQRLSVRSLLAGSPPNSQRSLLQQQTPQRLPGVPLMEDVQFSIRNDETDPNNQTGSITDSPPPSQRMSAQKNMVPYLESPAPIEDMSPRQRPMHQRKRLSFHLLYDGNEDNLNRADDEDHNHNNNTIPREATNQLMEHRNRMENDVDAVEHQNGNNQGSVDDTHQQHPLKKDSSSHHSSNHEDSSHHSNDMTQEDQTTENRQALGHSNIANVAACIVKEQNKNKDESEVSIEESSNSTIDKSQSSRTSTASNANRPKAKTSSSLMTQGESRIKAAIRPPRLLSNDKRNKWLDHLNSFQESNHDVDVQMQEFIKVPGAVEKTLTSGFLICVDSFLYVLTMLPIRFAWSLILLSLHYPFKWTKKPAGNYQFHRRHMYQLIQVGIILFIYRYILLPISIGKLYHWIRGQAMIKLYVLIAIVEVFDRLMCSLGQDCLDSLYWNTTRRPRSSRMVISASVVMAYTAVHSLILFVHVATLNVAMNSADEALLALLIAGNFAEIKSTVFKKYNKPSLFKIVASDICERFKLALFLGLVLLLNFCQGMDNRKMSDYQRIAAIVWMSELLCDWLKHAFITKFNFIPSSVYPEYGLLLAGDVTGIGHEGVNLDHSHAVVKRIGFAQMPLVCVMARLVREAVKYMFLRIDNNAVSFLAVVLASTGSWILLLVLKTFLGAYLQRTSLSKLHAAPELSQTPLKPKQKQQ